MKLDVSEIFRNYDQRKAIEHIENLRNDIRSKEESIKTFLKEKSSQVIDNTIKIKSVYASVDKITCHLEDIICAYNDLIGGVRNTASVNFGEPSMHTEKFGESEKEIIKEVWKRKCDSYDFLFQSCHLGRSTGEGKNPPCEDAYHIVKTEKEELLNYDCFYLNNYINHVYVDVNKKMSEENYSFVLNKLYTDIFLCIKVLSSLLKNEKIKNIYINMFNSNRSVLYLNTYVKKHKENFCDILLKLIYASYHNLAYNFSCKMDSIPQSVIVLLLFYNKQNCQIVEIVKDDLFKEILNARINLLHNFVHRGSHVEDEALPLHKIKALFLQITYLVLHTKYMILLLIDVSNERFRQGVKDGQVSGLEEGCPVEWEDKTAQTYDDHASGNDATDTEENLFLRRMQMDLFILQNIPHEKAKKNKQYFNYAINSMEEIKKTLNEGIAEKFSLLQKTYVQFARRTYDYMIHLLHVYYCKNDYSVTCGQLFTEYANINRLYNKMKGKIQMKEKYYRKYIKDVDFYLNNNYLHAIHDEVFQIFFFLFFNKFVCAIPFFDQNPVDKWKLVMTKFFHNLFCNISISYERNCEIRDWVFYSFLLNSFYYYWEFFSIDLDGIYAQFYNVDRELTEDQHIRKNDHKESTERVQAGGNLSREGHFHNGFKKILKEKIHPLIFSAYKLIIFIETKEINHSANADFLFVEQGAHDAADFFTMFDSFMSILKSHTREGAYARENANGNAIVQGEPTSIRSCGSDVKKESSNCTSNRCSNLVCFLKVPQGEDPTHVENTPMRKCPNDEATMRDNNVDCKTVNLEQEEQNGMVKGTGPPHSESMPNCGDQIGETENSEEEEYKELRLYVNLLRHNDKRAWTHFLSAHDGIDEAVADDSEGESNFSLNDLKGIFLHIVYKILKTSLKCFCVEYLDNLEEHLHFYLNMLINNDIKNILCEKMNGHLVNIFSFSNLFILYVERLCKTDMYRSIVIFLVKTALQKEVYKIYAQFICLVKEVYSSQYAQSNEKNKTLLNEKVTQLYNIILLDLSFCAYILDNNNIIHKSTYDDLMRRYRNYERYYIKSCLYFVHIYKEKYNVYSENMIECNTGRHPFWEKLNEKDAEKKKKKNAEMYAFKYLIDNILTELNNLDNLNGIIFQKHIRLLAQNVICDSYLLYYLFVEGPTINNLLDNVQTDTKTSSLEIFHFNQVSSIDDNSIEDNLLKFFF
ncbi:hypothetical protein C922_00162 [Plasmodium inui San Antonio 1]|uniref:Uncharacterized protein n=1 Tax=Plasmodium inui San Antonio 1 TaxID=1237626 RepID=W7AKD6_9APIC|nr:hypothetical protein C922_00162 [Plasmodium inui San Antonio 1]EUD69299.1 hypothetical protein C922_00162 [Plasmodium inui San Antonio 1]